MFGAPELRSRHQLLAVRGMTGLDDRFRRCALSVELHGQGGIKSWEGRCQVLGNTCEENDAHRAK